jgi:hypothetical protein
MQYNTYTVLHACTEYTLSWQIHVHLAYQFLKFEVVSNPKKDFPYIWSLRIGEFLLTCGQSLFYLRSMLDPFHSLHIHCNPRDHVSPSSRVSISDQGHVCRLPSDQTVLWKSFWLTYMPCLKISAEILLLAKNILHLNKIKINILILCQTYLTFIRCSYGVTRIPISR